MSLNTQRMCIAYLHNAVAVIIALICSFFLQNFEEPQKARLVAFACCINSKLSICDLSCFPSVQSALSSKVLLLFLVVIASDLVWYVLHNAVAVTLASSQ